MNQTATKRPVRRDILLFFLLVALVAFANGLSDSVMSNYFKEVFNMDAQQRAFIEFPRETPGLLCVFAIAALSFLGDLRLVVLAQLLSCLGIFALGVFSPSYTMMMLFLFIYSMGMHLFLPLTDSVGMALAEPDQLGRRVGQYGSIKAAFGFVSGFVVFFGFRYGIFSFTGEIHWVFVCASVTYLLAMVAAFFLLRESRGEEKFFRKKKLGLTFRKEYKYYYLLTILNGVQKQIALVFGSWVIVDLLLKGADVMSVLIMVASLLATILFRYLGRWIETRGIRFMMFLDALSFVFVYSIYGTVVWGLTDGWISNGLVGVGLVYVLFVLDRLSMQIGVVKAVYLRSIALTPEDVTTTLSTGTSLDHMVSIVAAQFSGLLWMTAGPQYVFFFAASLSLGNVYVATRMPKGH